MKELNVSEANKLAIEQQYLKIKLIENALTYTYKGEHILFGKKIDAGDLKRAQLELQELVRIKELHTSGKYNNLPYFNCNGITLDKVKEHFNSEGTFAFIEIKESSRGKYVMNHKLSKSSILKQIKQKQMATKKKAAAKKAAPKKAASKKSSKKAAPKKTVKTEGDSIRTRVDKLVGQGKDNKAIMEALDKDGIVYSIKSVRWYASKARALA
jgi:hypothetical protein